MKSILMTTALGSAIVFGSMLGAGLASAQDATNSAQPCVGESCPKPEMKKAPGQDDMNQGDMNQNQGGSKKRKNVDQSNQMNDQTEGTSDGTTKRKKKTQNSQNTDVDVDVDVRTGSSQRARHVDWHFDSSRHQRRRSKSATFTLLLRRLLVPAALLGSLLSGLWARQLRRGPRHCCRALQSRARRRVQGADLYLSRPPPG